MAGEQNPFNNGYNDVLDWLAPTPGYQYGDVLPLRQKVVPYAPGKGPVSPGLPTGLRNLLLGGAELVNSPFTGTFGQNGLAALMALGGGAGLAAPKEGAMSGVFIGSRAPGADTGALARAMSMDSKGAGREETRANTGWFKDYDGNWKSEVPDDQARLKLGALGQNSFNKDLYHVPLFPSADAPQLTLGSVLDHPALYQARPDVANIPLKSTGLSIGIKGAYDEPTDTMSLAGATPDNLLSTILHETQHAIQGRENFPRGANPAMFRPPGFAEEERQFELESKGLLESLQGLGLNRYSAATLVNRAESGNPRFGNSAYFPDEKNQWQKLQSAGLVPQLKAFLEKDKQLSAIRDQSMEDYLHTAGEVESRTVQARQDYTPAERAEEPPWITTQQSASHNLGILPEDMIFILPNGQPAMIRAGKAYAPKPLDPSLVTKLPGEAPPAAPTGLSASELPSKAVEGFKGLGSAQRGEPEQAMLRVQRALGGGVLNPVVEHIGDLTHRMSHLAEYDNYLPDIMDEKVKRGLYYLQHPYGFQKELGENMRANAQERGMTLESYKQNLDKTLGDYATAHEKLPVYNRAQYLSREAAVAVGKQRYNQAISHLQELQQMIRSGKWDEHATEHHLDSNDNLIPYTPPK